MAYVLGLAEGAVTADAPPVRRLLSVLRLHISDAIGAGYNTFLVGMARGVDLWAADIITEIKRKDPSVRLICVMPYRCEGARFKGSDRVSYVSALQNADETVYVSESYTRFCMSLRNKYMVNHSSRIIGVVSDYKSGTGATIRYAQSKHIECDIIDLNKSQGLFAF